jgi:tRNA C32,U32 (ribose-2'-O)-methylase TrmJ
MSEENKVSDEAVVDSGTENNTQEPAQNEYIAESKKYRKRAQDAETRLAKLEQQLQSQENAKLKEKEEFKTLAKREQFTNKELDVLEFMVSELSSNTPAEPQVRGTVKAPKKDIGDWTKLSDKDKRENWADILKSYTKK